MDRVGFPFVGLWPQVGVIQVTGRLLLPPLVRIAFCFVCTNVHYESCLRMCRRAPLVCPSTWLDSYLQKLVMPWSMVLMAARSKCASTRNIASHIEPVRRAGLLFHCCAVRRLVFLAGALLSNGMVVGDVMWLILLAHMLVVLLHTFTWVCFFAITM